MFALLFLAVMCALSSFAARIRVIWHLSEKHPEEYEAMGRPGLIAVGSRSQADVGLAGLIARGSLPGVVDPELSALARSVRINRRVRLALFAALGCVVLLRIATGGSS